MAFYATDLTTPFKSSILDRIASRLYGWFINVRFRHRITLERRSVAEFEDIWTWCGETFEHTDWTFTWDGTNIHEMTFCFRKPKQLVYFALRWA